MNSADSRQTTSLTVRSNVQRSIIVIVLNTYADARFNVQDNLIRKRQNLGMQKDRLLLRCVLRCRRGASAKHELIGRGQ